MMMVTAATPASPAKRSMVQLNSRVTIPVTKAVAISEQPLAAASPSTRSRKAGRTKYSRLPRRLNTASPTTAVTEYPRPVATAAPPMPMRHTAIRT